MSAPDFTKVALDFGPTGAGPARDVWNTPEGLTVQTAYGTDAVQGLDFIHGLPGIAPYVRGPYPTMYAGNPWTIRQYAGFSTAEASTPSIAETSPPVRRGCRSPSIWPLTAATIPTTRG
jgi:methylmalonyl-CoA mutase